MLDCGASRSRAYVTSLRYVPVTSGPKSLQYFRLIATVRSHPIFCHLPIKRHSGPLKLLCCQTLIPVGREKSREQAVEFARRLIAGALKFVLKLLRKILKRDAP